MKHLYAPEACPNYPHGIRGQKPPTGTCPLCGRNPRAFLLGERLARITVGGVLALIFVGGGALVWRWLA